MSLPAKGSAEFVQQAEQDLSSGAYPQRGLTLVAAEGARLWDDQGRSYLDCISGQGAAILGHAPPALTQAIAEQAGKGWNCPASFSHPVRDQVLQDLAGFTGMGRFFLCNSGAEAVESALKLARIVTGRTRVLALRRGFHGRTLGALSATWNPRFRRHLEPLLGGVGHLPFGEEAALDAVDESVAGVLLEPVQGEGGVHLLGQSYYRALREACTRSGALLMLDEVQTGFGRTGRAFAYEHLLPGEAEVGTLQPDVLVMAKGMAGGFPMGAIGWRRSLPAFPRGSHGSTFGGNLLACVACSTTMKFLRDERVIERAARLGSATAAFLHRQLNSNPWVRDLRGLGLMWGIELRQPVAPLLQDLQRRGILALSAGPRVLRLLPPLTIPESDWWQVLGRVVQGIQRSAAQGDRR